MITIERTFPLQLNYDLSRIAPPGEILFFDIETTGLSAYSSSLYLIGAVFLRDGSWYFRQWFAESLSQEEEVLTSFFRFTGDFSVLLHFNGDQFDIRFLNDTAAQYGIASPLSSLRSVDILKMIRRRKALFGLPNLRQKTIESFLGISREDRYTGGELIEIYEAYTKSRDPGLLSLLLLHNEEDIKGMPGILPVLSYLDAFQSAFELADCSRNKGGTYLDLKLRFSFRFPAALDHIASDGVRLHFEQDCLRLRFPLCYRELKYFYPDSKNYFYLPLEDTAVHKKLATFVDKDYREPAKAENCYTRMEGFYLPHFKGCSAAEFRESYKSRPVYVRLEEEDAFLTRYAAEYLAAF